MTPAAVEEKYGADARRSTPTSPRCVGEPSDNLPGVPGVGEKTAAKWIREYGVARGARRPRRRDQGQGRRRAARAPRRRGAATAELTELVARPAADADPDDLRAAAVGPRRRCTRSSTTLRVPGAARPAVRTRWRRAEPEAEEGFDVDGRARSAPGGAAPGWPRTPPTGTPVGVAVAGTLRAAAPATLDRGRAAPPPTARRRYVDPAALDRDDERGAGRPGWPTRAGPRCCTTPRGRCSRCARARLAAARASTSDTALAAYLVRPDQRSLRPRRPRRCATCSASCAADERRRRPARSLDGDGRRRPRPSDLDAARPAPSLDLADALDAELAETAAHRAAGRRGAAAGRRAGRAWRRAGIAVDTEHLDGAGGALRRARSQAAAQAAYAVIGARVQPRLAQAAAGGAVRRAGPAQDQEDQDRLHHRRRRAAVAVRADRAPVPRAPAAPPRRRRSCSRPSRAC